ncbi:MAG: ISNCY family transposase [Candidatus Binatia bacterium]
MRRPISQQMSFGDGFIDASLYELDEELKQVDELLSDPQLLRPFEEAFDPSLGRPGTAVGIYLRMMYLKFRWGLSYEEVEREVRERLPWRYFCRLSLMDSVPDATTLIKLNQRFGEDRINGLNKRLVKQLLKSRSIKPRRIRIDSTTLEAHISYPNDVGIIHQAIKTLTRTAASLGQRITNHIRASKRAGFNWSQTAKANPKQRKERGRKILKHVAKLVGQTVEQSRKAFEMLADSASNGLGKLKQRFSEQIELAQTIVSQTQEKLQGKKSIQERIVSFYDPQARPIRKGKLSKAVEFGRTLQMVQDSSGVILHYEVRTGNPADRTELLSVLRNAKTSLAIKPKELAADRGYYSAENVLKLGKAGIEKVGIPKIGRLNKTEKRHQRTRWFRQLQRFRCGIEAGISMLKRKFGLGRVLARGSTGTAIWTGLAIFAYNVWQRT